MTELAQAQSANRRLIIVRREDGLGGRLLAFVRVLRFADKVGASVIWKWPPTGGHGVSALGGLFDLGISDLRNVTVMEEPLTDLPREHLYIEGDPLVVQSLRNGVDPEVLFGNQLVIESSGQRLLRVKNESDAEIAEEMRRVFDRLVPIPSVGEALKAARSTIGSQPYAAVHVRRGDILRNVIQEIKSPTSSERLKRWLQFFVTRCAPVELMLASLNAKSSDKRILVIGDDPSITEMIRRHLGPNRAINLGSNEFALTISQQALLDILLLRSAEDIHAPSSQFSRCAAEIGTATTHIIQPHGDPSPWLSMFESEVLDAANVPAEQRNPFRVAFMAEWTPLAERIDRRNARYASTQG